MPNTISLGGERVVLVEVALTDLTVAPVDQDLGAIPARALPAGLSCFCLGGVDRAGPAVALTNDGPAFVTAGCVMDWFLGHLDAPSALRLYEYR